MVDAESLIGLILSGIGIFITLIIPVPLKEEYRLFIITAIIFTILVVLLSRFDERLKKQDKNIGELNKRFKTIEELNEIRLDIREIKRKVFPNEQKSFHR